MKEWVEKAKKLMLIKLIGFPNIIEHTLKVRKKALEIGRKLKEKGFNVNLDLLEAGCYLHDIGRSIVQDVRHGVEGGKICREYGFPEEIVRMVERHVGAGITAEEAKKLGLPEKDYIPETLEEKILSYADKFVESKFTFKTINGEQIVERKEVLFKSIEPTIKKFVRIFGERSPIVSRLINLRDEMKELLN